MSSKVNIFHISRLAVIVIFLIILAWLYNLQIIQGEKYLQIAENNYVRVKKISPLRGEVFDRKYRPIITNTPSLNLYYLPGKVANRDSLVNFVSQNIDIEASELTKLLHNNRFRTYREVLIYTNISFQKYLRMGEHLHHYPALLIKKESTRRYHYNNCFTGYVAKLNETEYKHLKEEDYSLDEVIGKSGLEKQYEEVLRGTPGYRVLQVNAQGKNLGFFEHNLEREATNGSDLILYLDNQLQAYIMSILPAGSRACVGVMDVRTGGMLAYVSNPAIDQNIFLNRISTAKWDSMLINPAKPMLDRLSQAAYPPGSVFKPLIGLLALEKKLVNRYTKLSSCDGGKLIGSKYFKCWNEFGHGSTNLEGALKMSCDVYFYDLSLLLQLDEIYEYTEKSYLLAKTGLDIPGERKGFFPSHAWYTKNYGKYFGVRGHKVNLCIGQGEVSTTPLQILCYYAALANDGVWRTPRFAERTLDKKIALGNQGEEKNLPVSASNLKIVQAGLLHAVTKKYGTAKTAAVGGVDIYGKTGSAENHQGEVTHAWYAGYGVWDEPEVAIVVFLENAGHGGQIAAPLAGQILKFYHENVR